MSREYEGQIEIFADGYGVCDSAVYFSIDYDFTPPKTMHRWNDGDPADAPEGAEVTVTRVQLRCNGEPAECPKWLEQIILQAIDDEVLIEHAMEDA